MSDSTKPASLTIDSISPPEFEPRKSPDKKTRVEKEKWDLARHLKKMAGLEAVGFKQDTNERKAYAKRIFYLVCVWLIAVLLILVAVGFSWHSFVLSDKVLLALIGGTSVNVLGLFAIVANYLFPKRRSRRSLMEALEKSRRE